MTYGLYVAFEQHPRITASSRRELESKVDAQLKPADRCKGWTIAPVPDAPHWPSESIPGVSPANVLWATLGAAILFTVGVIIALSLAPLH